MFSLFVPPWVKTWAFFCAFRLPFFHGVIEIDCPHEGFISKWCRVLGAWLLWFLCSHLSFLSPLLFFFSFLKPNMDLCFYSKSCYTEVFIVCDCFEGRRVAAWFHIPYLRLLVLNMVLKTYILDRFLKLKTYILVSKTSIWKFPAVILGPCSGGLTDFLCIYISALMRCSEWLKKINENFSLSFRGELITIAKRSSSKHLEGTKVLWGDI